MYVFVAVKPQTRRLAVARLKHHAERGHSYRDEYVQEDAGEGNEGQEANEAKGTHDDACAQGTTMVADFEEKVCECQREEEDTMDAKEDGRVEELHRSDQQRTSSDRCGH